MNGLQARLARAALAKSVRELAELCGVSTKTIQRIEESDETVKVSTSRKLRAAYESLGVEFIGTDGVRMRGPFSRV